MKTDKEFKVVEVSLESSSFWERVQLEIYTDDQLTQAWDADPLAILLEEEAAY